MNRWVNWLIMTQSVTQKQVSCRTFNDRSRMQEVDVKTSIYAYACSTQIVKFKQLLNKDYISLTSRKSYIA